VRERARQATQANDRRMYMRSDFAALRVRKDVNEVCGAFV